MEEFTSRIASCSGVASRRLDDRGERRRRRRGRRGRSCAESSGTNERTVAAAPSRAVRRRRARASSSGVRSGVSPERTSTSSASADAPRAPQRTASPVPSGSLLDGDLDARRTRRRSSGEATTTSGSAPSGARGREHPVDHPPAEERVQVLRRSPSACACRALPAITTAASVVSRHGVDDGWGARIRTWDHGTKTRCLTTWPRPSAGTGSLPSGRSPAVDGRAGARRARSPRERDDRDRGEHDDAPASSGHEHDEQPARRPPIQVTSRTSGASRCSRPQADVERERAEREEDDEPPRDRAREDEDALDERRSRARP